MKTRERDRIALKGIVRSLMALTYQGNDIATCIALLQAEIRLIDRLAEAENDRQQAAGGQRQ